VEGEEDITQIQTMDAGRTCKSVFSTIIFSVEMNRSISVLGWGSPSGAFKKLGYIFVGVHD
jgi:hypothetical protein